MSGHCGVVIVYYVMNMSLEPSQNAVLSLANILYATNIAGDDIY